MAKAFSKIWKFTATETAVIISAPDYGFEFVLDGDYRDSCIETTESALDWVEYGQELAAASSNRRVADKELFLSDIVDGIFTCDCCGVTLPLTESRNVGTVDYCADCGARRQKEEDDFETSLEDEMVEAA